MTLLAPKTLETGTTVATVGQLWGSGGAYAYAEGFLASVECEIEQVRNYSKQMTDFKVVQDGSLRNNGLEFISSMAQDRVGLVSAFSRLHTTLQLGSEPFSERTSTHVHVNVSNMRLDHARQMVLLYALFEEIFFAMVKPNRRDNIHCVPLTETYLPEKYKMEFRYMEDHWHKYTALNLKRIKDLGTMEFRHLHGTADVTEFNQWVNVLENLYKLSQRVTLNEITLADKATVMEWFQAIFFPSDKVMRLRPSLHDIIRNSLIDVKMSTVA